VRRAAMLVAMAAASCSGMPPHPESLDTRNEICAFCRMAISDARLASQIVAPSEEPKFFDDIGCLRDHLREHHAASGAVAYVADHRTKAWVSAAQAVFTRVPGLETPMASHLLAHADAVSRDRDPDVKGGESVALTDLFGADGPPSGRR
jgi:copper chaperone NosL